MVSFKDEICFARSWKLWSTKYFQIYWSFTDLKAVQRRKKFPFVYRQFGMESSHFEAIVRMRL